MKASRGNGLRGTVVLALLFGAAYVSAQTQSAFTPQPATAVQQAAPSNPAPAPETDADKVPIVAEVRVVTESGKVLPDAATGLPIPTSKPLERAKVAESLRILFRTGDYADVSAVQTPVAGGVRIDFIVREQLFFNRVVIQGLVAPPSDASAAAAMQFSLGQPYRKDIVDEGVARLRETLHEEGLYAAEISAEAQAHPDTRQMDIFVHVKSGPRARVKEIQLKNGTEYPDKTVLSGFKMKAGREITSAKISRGTERVRKFLVKKGHLNARAVVHRGEYDAAKNVVPLELDVTEGPRVKITATGAKFSDGELKKLVPVYQEGAVDPDLLEEGRKNIRERLERQGYFDAEVDYTTITHEAPQKGGAIGTEEVITYKIERGDQHKLVGIAVTGNQYFNTELLRSRLQIFGKAFGSRGRFSRRLVDSDKDSLLNLYLANGFQQAKVDAQLLDNYQGKEGDLFVRFVVDEGKQTRVASLKVDGLHALKENDLLGVVGSTPGQPYSEFLVATDRDNILAIYYNEGFPDARFTAVADPIPADAKPENESPAAVAGSATPKSEKKKSKNGGETFEGDLVQLRYHIDEGLQRRVRRILETGYVHTRPGVIRREISVKQNDPLRERDVVETQRRLYNLGVFNRVTVEPQNPTGTDTNKDIVVLVEEAKRYTIAYGGGIEVQRLASTNDPTKNEIQAAVRGIFEISKLNLTGRGDSLSLKLRGSTIEDRALLTYSDPNTFANPRYTFQATVYTEKTQDINTFTQTRYEGNLQLTDQATRLTTWSYRYSFRKVLLSNLNSTVSPEQVPLFEQPTLVSQFGVTWARDRRDNPAEATKGSFNSADFGIADTGIGSSASFLRFYFQNSTYHPIGRRFSFARALRIGILEPYKDTESLSFPVQTAQVQLIPLPERFFAGGGTSLRGFALNQAGPRDSAGFPVGGQALLEFHQELRFPMRLPFIGTALGGALFYDGGNVYSRLARITFRSSPPKPIFDPANPLKCLYNCTNELNYFSHTVGIGFRYSTPVGPIRIDLGFPINRPQFVAPICPTGDASCLDGSNGFKATRLPGFQIFFNLGSTF
jgi:outer membrane protein insertion porin family